MSDEARIRSGQVGDGSYTGVSYTAIPLAITSASGPEAQGRLKAFLAELEELLEAHPSIELVKDRLEWFRAMETTLQVRLALERAEIAERAQRQ